MCRHQDIRAIFKMPTPIFCSFHTFFYKKSSWLVVSAHQQEDYIHKQKFPERVTVHHHIY